MKKFLKSMLSENGKISSKRAMGVLGWIVCIFICIWCTIKGSENPSAVEYLFICSASLLGIDSIMRPFTKQDKHYYDEEDEDI